LSAAPKELGLAAERFVVVHDGEGRTQFLGERLVFALGREFAPQAVAGQGEFEGFPGPLGRGVDSLGQPPAVVGEPLDEEVHRLLAALGQARGLARPADDEADGDQCELHRDRHVGFYFLR